MIREWLILILMSCIGGIFMALGVEDRFEAKVELWLAAASCFGAILLIACTIRPKKKRGATRL